MKLIYCPKCQDVVALTLAPRSCLCGQASGRYIDPQNVQVSMDAVVLGFANDSFLAAVRNRPLNEPSKRFTAFVIPKNCITVEEV